MLFRFHFIRNLEGPIDYWVRIELENEDCILDWIGISADHPVLQVTSTVGIEKGESLLYLIELNFEQFLELELPQLVFSNWEYNCGYF